MCRCLRFAPLALLLLAVQAQAHGGHFRDRWNSAPPGMREPDDPVPPPPPPGVGQSGAARSDSPAARPLWPVAHLIPCDCATLGCSHCGDRTFTREQPELDAGVTEEVLRRWDDFAQLRITLSLRGTVDRPVEAYVSLAPGPLFAPAEGRIEQGASALAGSFTPSRDARRRYLYAKRTGLDPFLLLPLSPGRYALRAFPIGSDQETRVVVEGVVLAPALARGEPRLYRDGEHLLVVEDGTASAGDGFTFADAGSRRTLRFLSREEGRRRYGARVDEAAALPGVAALKTAAAGDTSRVLLAIEEGAVTPEVAPDEPPAPAPPDDVAPPSN